MNGQVTITTTATEVLPANRTPCRVILQNTGAVNVFVGEQSVTISNGFLLVPGAWCRWDKTSSGAIYAITPAATSVLKFVFTKEGEGPG